MQQIRLLARAFFSRLFESDLMPEGLPQVQLVIWGMLFAATPTTAYAMMLPKKYQFAQFFGPLAPEFDADRLSLITLSMIVIGVVGLFIWDGVFPDRRDVRILGPLPVAVHRFVIARLAALGRVYALFATPLCAMQSIVFGLSVTGFGAPIGRIHGIGAHFVAVMLACAFVFCALIAAQCVLLLVFGRRAAQAASVVFQVLFAIALVQLLFFLPELGRMLRTRGVDSETLSALSAVPPIWFFSVYERLAGGTGAATLALATMATGLTGAAVLLAPALYGLSYSHLSQRALEGPVRRPRHLRLRTVRGTETVSRYFAGPLAAAVRAFALRTLFRSRSHRMMFAVYAGFAFAIVISSAVSILLRNRGAGFWRPGAAMTSMPLAIQFILMAAIRAISAVPSEPKARWVFRICEPADRPGAVSGMRDAMLALVVVPTTIFALAQGLLFWSVAAALSHAAFVFVMGRLLAELVTPKSGKLPFACTYLPGESRLFAMWPIYLLAFFTYSVAFAEIDVALTTRPGKLIAFCAAATLVAQGAVAMRRRTLRALTGLRFEAEDPNAIFRGFDLSEGLAAAPRQPSTAAAQSRAALDP